MEFTTLSRQISASAITREWDALNESRQVIPLRKSVNDVVSASTFSEDAIRPSSLRDGRVKNSLCKTLDIRFDLKDLINARYFSSLLCNAPK